MDYYVLHIACNPEQKEIINGFLSLYDEIQALVETDIGLDAYVPINQYTEELDFSIVHFALEWQILFTKEIQLSKNWNEVWEANFSPVVVGRFCAIRADFHPLIPDVKYDVVIHPKNAFGTGHHETTNMMIQLMELIPFSGISVLDFGSGTGILAILAAKLGAKHVTAIDIETSAIENIVENAQKNQVALEIIPGSLEVVSDYSYDVILANIHLNVLVKYAPGLIQMLAPQGRLLLSGILDSQDQDIIKAFQSLDLQQKKSQEHWMSYYFAKG